MEPVHCLQGTTGRELLQLTDALLEQVGVKNPLHRLQLLGRRDDVVTQQKAAAEAAAPSHAATAAPVNGSLPSPRTVPSPRTQEALANSQPGRTPLNSKVCSQSFWTGCLPLPQLVHGVLRLLCHLMQLYLLGCVRQLSSPSVTYTTYGAGLPLGLYESAALFLMSSSAAMQRLVA